MRLNIDRNQITVEDMGQHGMPKNFTNTTCRSYAIYDPATFQLACPLSTINRKANQSIIGIIASITIESPDAKLLFLIFYYLFP